MFENLKNGSEIEKFRKSGPNARAWPPFSPRPSLQPGLKGGHARANATAQNTISPGPLAPVGVTNRGY